MFSKKSQGAVEFLIILVFMMVLLSFVMYFIGIYSIDFQKKENKMSLDGFANSIQNEVKTLQEAQIGYERELIIPKYLVDRYNISFQENYLIIYDLEHQEDNIANGNYYYLEGDFKINVTTTMDDDMLISFKKIDNSIYLPTSKILLG